VLGYSAFPSGSALLPMTVLIMIGMIVLAPRMIGRFGPKAMVVRRPDDPGRRDGLPVP